MTNNQILYRIATALNLSEENLLEIFQKADPLVTAQDVEDIMKKENEPDFVLLSDTALTLFLDGLIAHRRGGEIRASDPDVPLSNNLILKKLRIALELKEEDLIPVFERAGTPLKPYEVTAFFRKEGHRNYRRCGDKMLGAFLKAMALPKDV